MPSLGAFLVAQTEASARGHARRSQLVSGVVVRFDGGQAIVTVGGQTFGAQPTLAQPLLRGDRVWISMGFGQPKVVGLQGRDEGVASG